MEVWQLAREIVNDVYKLTNKNKFSKDFTLRNQIRSSSISILSNISEGFESGTDPQFARYLNIAKGSAGECRAQLYVALDQEYISKMEFEALKEKLIKESKKLARLIGYLKRDTNYANEFEIIYET